MNEMLESQEILMRLLGVTERDGSPSKGVHQSLILSATIGMAVEAAETLDELNRANRPWKPTSLNMAAFLEEMTDVVFYILEDCVLLGLTERHLAMLYEHKYLKNLCRIVERLERSQIISIFYSILEIRIRVPDFKITDLTEPYGADTMILSSDDKPLGWESTFCTAADELIKRPFLGLMTFDNIAEFSKDPKAYLEDCYGRYEPYQEMLRMSELRWGGFPNEA